MKTFLKTTLIFSTMFAILKLLGIIDWSWWWILTPLWFPVASVFVTIVGAYFFLKIFTHKLD